MNELENVPLDTLPNPYDFGNPVARKDLFIGRAKEQEDIEYYLNHAKNADRSINLALLGERAAGKTSLLNMIQLAAKDRGLVPVRINLNESDVESAFAFWFKLFDAVLSTVVASPSADGRGFVFNGETGGTYDAYLSLISSYEVPQDNTFCPFLFPIQYARASSAGRTNVRVSDQILMRDLKLIADEVKRPIVLLVDECNVLSSHRALLEMVRNTFMNLPGFMLVFTGTPDLFPVMDEVFSPIVRQFKRIEVKPFSDLSDTRTAVVNPLKLIGKESLFPIRESASLGAMAIDYPGPIGAQLRDLHDLTGGKPYEIQLVCHFMFKRAQRNKSERMRLSYEVIEDVLSELGQAHDLSTRPTIKAVNALDLMELRTLELCLLSGGKIAVSQLLLVSGLTNRLEFSQAELSGAYERLKECGILKDNGGCASFCGDDFDRIVCKYAGRQRGVHLQFTSISPGYLIENFIVTSTLPSTLRDEVSLLPVSARILPMFSSHRESEQEAIRDLDRIWPSMIGWSITKLCQSIPSVIQEWYEFILDNEENLDLGVVAARIQIVGEGLQLTSYLCQMCDAKGMHATKLHEVCQNLKQRSIALGCECDVSFVHLLGGSVESIIELALLNDDEDANDEIGGVHGSAMYDSYVSERDKVKALKHAKRAASFAKWMAPDDLNNMGYILLGGKAVSQAIVVLQELIKRDVTHNLGKYNLAVASVLNNDCAMAVSLLEEVVHGESLKPYKGIGYLWIPKWSNEEIELIERHSSMTEDDGVGQELCLANAAREVLENVKQLHKPSFQGNSL